MMEDEARRIGLKKSTFRNPTGLDDPEQLMTARELALLAQHLIKDYPEYYTRSSPRRSSPTASTSSTTATRCSGPSSASMA